MDPISTDPSSSGQIRAPQMPADMLGTPSGTVAYDAFHNEGPRRQRRESEPPKELKAEGELEIPIDVDIPPSRPSAIWSCEETAEPIPLLVRAAHDVAKTMGPRHTVVDVLHHRALRLYGEGLRQYLAIRLNNADAAHGLMDRLRAFIAATNSEQLAAAPGVRARLYRFARDIAFGAPVEEGELVFRSSGSSRAQEYASLRAKLETDESEMLELRYARELRPVEIAHVVGRPIEDVIEVLDGASRYVKKALDTERSLRDVLVEVFALEGAKTPVLPEGENEELSGRTIAQRYILRERVGTGSFGDVYRAEDSDVPGHVVALKLLHQPAYGEDARSAVLRELRHLAAVTHPSVVHLKDHGWYEGRLWFVMPWYEGETLQERIEREPLTRAEARRIFEPLARAVVAIHAAGLRHQDIKPENVILARMPGVGIDDELPVLIDFGVAATEAEMLVAGTPTYFAPEVAAQFAYGKYTFAKTEDGTSRSERSTTLERIQAQIETAPIGKAADVFSLALALRNSLDPSLEADIPAGATEAFIEERASAPLEGPGGRGLRYLGSSFERWLSPDPSERPSALEFAEELSILTEPEETRARRKKVRRILFFSALVLAGVMVLAFEHFQTRETQVREEAAAEVAFAQQTVHQSALARARIEADAERIRSSLESERLDRSEVEGRLAMTLANLTDARHQGERTTRQLERTREERQVAVQELAQTGERLERVQTELQQMRASRDRMETQAQTNAEERDRVHAELQAERAAQDALREELGALEAEMSSLRAENVAAEARADSLEDQIGEMARSRRAAERALEQLRAASAPASPRETASAENSIEEPAAE